MYIMILSIMYYFTNFGDLCDSGSFHLYRFPGSTTHYDKKFILLLLTSYISEIKLFLLFLFFLSKNMLQSNNRNYWENAEIIRTKNFNTVPVIDGTQGDAAIADLFKDVYSILYNSVSSSTCSDSMDALHERIRHAIETQCNTNVESSLHTHSVSTADVIKAVKRLKTDKYNDDGIIMSNNFQHGIYLLYTRIAQLFSAMLYYGYTPQLFYVP